MKSRSTILTAALVPLFLGLVVLSPGKKKIKLWLIGDSTVCLYDPSRAPINGWGMPFAGFFDSTVTMNNRAKGGRSTRTFLSENRWQPIADSISEGDYVIIQFGHNDEAKEEKYKDRYTPVEDYKTNLIRFITETRLKKGIPLLVTPVTRMRFDKNGKALETHVAYSAAVFEAGKQTNTPVINLDSRSRELLQQMGPEHAKLLYMQLDSLEHPNYPAGQKDNTHFNEYGARRMAELVLAEMKRLNIELITRVITNPIKK